MKYKREDIVKFKEAVELSDYEGSFKIIRICPDHTYPYLLDHQNMIVREDEIELVEAAPINPKVKIIENTISDLLSGFLHYDRKEDEDLPVGSIEEEIKSGRIERREIIYMFTKELKELL